MSYANMTRWGGRRECARRERQYRAGMYHMFPLLDVDPSAALVAARERNAATSADAARRRKDRR